MIALIHFFREEIKRVRKLQNIKGYIIAPFFISAKIKAFAVFLVYSLTGGYMSADRVFFTLTLYQAVKSATTLFMPLAVFTSAETNVAVERIEVSTAQAEL